jgi:hypothetical protein
MVNSPMATCSWCRRAPGRFRGLTTWIGIGSVAFALIVLIVA